MTFTVAAAGDVLLHERTWYTADDDAGIRDDGQYDFAPQFAPIAPVISAADLALCHLETPLAPPEGPFHGYPSFSGPPQVAAGLAATGFDACSYASNHSWDQGRAGLDRTLQTVAAAGITPYGAAAGPTPANPTMIDTGDVTVGLLSYTYGFNGSSGDGSVEVIDIPDALADAATARAAGADLVIASVHWGNEYDHDINALQADTAPALLGSADIDLVIGHHAHVVQPFENINGKWVAYGLGNMVAAHGTDNPANAEGVIAQFTFTHNGADWRVTEAAYLPIMVERGLPLRVIDLPVALAGDLPAELRTRYQIAVDRTRDIVRRRAGGEALVEVGTTG